MDTIITSCTCFNDSIYHEGTISRLSDFYVVVFFLLSIFLTVINYIMVYLSKMQNKHSLFKIKGAQCLSGRVLDSRPRGRGFEPHRRHCVVVLEQDTFILAEYLFNPG